MCLSTNYAISYEESVLLTAGSLQHLIGLNDLKELKSSEMCAALPGFPFLTAYTQFLYNFLPLQPSVLTEDTCRFAMKFDSVIHRSRNNN